MNREGIVFLDANILIHADHFHSDNVFDWLEQVYDDIYIHKAVFDEIYTPALKSFVQDKFDSDTWTLFDEADDALLTDEQFDEFNTLIEIVKAAFRKVHEWKEANDIPVKDTKNTGELFSLAAALLLDARYICSNDFEISQVIDMGDLRIPITEEDDALIAHDTLLDFCCLAVEMKIAPRKKIKKFLSHSDIDRLKEFDRRNPV